MFCYIPIHNCIINIFCEFHANICNNWVFIHESRPMCTVENKHAWDRHLAGFPIKKIHIFSGSKYLEFITRILTKL